MAFPLPRLAFDGQVAVLLRIEQSTVELVHLHDRSRGIKA